MPHYMLVSEETIRAAMSELARRRWAKATKEDKARQVAFMVAGRRKQLRARKRAKKSETDKGE